MRAPVPKRLGHGERLGEHLVSRDDLISALSREAKSVAAAGEETTSVGGGFGSHDLQDPPRDANRFRAPRRPHQQIG